MALDQFLTLIATILGAIGSVYVLKSILRLTPDITERLSSGFYGHNPNQIDSLSLQKAEGIVGASLIILALAIAIINAAFTPSTILIYPRRLVAVLIAVAFAAIIYFLMTRIGKVIYLQHRRAVARIILAQTLDRLFKSNNVPDYEIRSLYNLADKYLDLNLQPNATPRDLLLSLTNEIGRTIPEDIEVEGEKPSQTHA
jgi:sensor histidine kinase YesM